MGHLTQLFDMSLNYTAGGSQYLSCIKCATCKMEGGQIMVIYSMYGKRWIEQETYKLNRDFCESAPVPQKLKNFLEHGAAVGMQHLLGEERVIASLAALPVGPPVVRQHAVGSAA